MSDDNETTIVPFRPTAVDSPVPAKDEPTEFNYCVRTTDGQEFYRRGFCIFTNAHVVIMKELKSGVAYPIVVVPNASLDSCFIVEDDDDATPF